MKKPASWLVGISALSAGIKDAILELLTSLIELVWACVVLGKGDSMRLGFIEGWPC
jgi:hypothetical protein